MAGFYDRTIYEAHQKGQKVLLALGGWTDSGTDKYSRMVGNSAARRRFVKAAVTFLIHYGFDGLSLDWHYPVCWQANCNRPKAASDREGFTKLVKELKSAFKAKGNLILAASLAGHKAIAQKAYDIPQISKV